MIYFYSHGFHSGRGCATFENLSKGLNITPYELIYENGGDFMKNLMSLKAQFMQILAKSKEDFTFIGNSLGAFYLWQLCLFAKSLSIPTPARLILFNPVVFPLYQLHKYIDKIQINHSTNARFLFTRAVWGSYENAQFAPMPQSVRLKLCLADNDELIESAKSQAFFAKEAEIVHFHGGHSISDFTLFRDLLL